MRRLTVSLLASQPSLHGRWKRILDAGCGTGGNLRLLQQYGEEVIAADISPVALGYCRRRGPWPILQASVETLPFADATFDAIACFDVLCQIPPDEADGALQEFHRVVRPRGFLIVRVPAYQWLHSRHDEVLHTYRRYTSRELARKLSFAGFRILRLTYANSLLFPLAAVWRLWQKLGISKHGSDLVPMPRPVNNAFLTALEVEARLLRHFPLGFGLSVMALGQKVAE